MSCTDKKCSATPTLLPLHQRRAIKEKLWKSNQRGKYSNALLKKVSLFLFVSPIFGNVFYKCSSSGHFEIDTSHLTICSGLNNLARLINLRTIRPPLWLINVFAGGGCRAIFHSFHDHRRDHDHQVGNEMNLCFIKSRDILPLGNSLSFGN